MKFSDANSFSLIYNNTVSKNSISGINVVSGSSPTISNCIIWDCNNNLYNCSATYSCIQNGDIGTGNLNLNPNFVYADHNNFHILSISPCINAGDPNDPNSSTSQVDIDNEVRVLQGRVDIGADELDYVCDTCSGDLNGDGYVTNSDLALMLHSLANTDENWYPAGSGQGCHDLNSDGYITSSDYAILTTNLANAPGGWYQCE